MASTWPELHSGTNFNYVWDTVGLEWVKETQSAGGGGGGAVTVTKVALTGSAPAAVSVGVASGAAVALNASRKGLVLINTSASTISLGLNGNAAVLNSGITLRPQQSWYMDEYTYTTGAIAAIASGAASNLAIQEMT